MLLLVLTLGSVPAQAAEPNVLAPYRFQPPPETLSPVEQQRALDYRNQIQSQLRQLERQRSTAPLNGFEQRRLMDTRGELGRMNRVLTP